MPRYRRRTLPLSLRNETRTALVMLTEIQHDEEDGPRHQGIQYAVNDLVDAVVNKKFFDTFGVSSTEFLARCRRLPSDRALRDTARRLLARKFAAIQSGDFSAGT